MARPKSNNSNASKKRSAQRTNQGKIFATKVKCNVSNNGVQITCRVDDTFLNHNSKQYCYHTKVMVRPKRNNSNASKKRLRIEETNVVYKMADKDDRAIAETNPRPTLIVGKNQMNIKAPIDTGESNRIRKRPTRQNTSSIPRSVYFMMRSHILKMNV